MARTPPAIVTASVLIWARKSYMLSVEDAAKRIGVSPEKLLSWEQGESLPSVAQARKISNVYKRPLAVFFLPTPPKDFDAIRDFRRLDGIDDEPDLSPKLSREFRRIASMREFAIELAEESGEVVITPQVDFSHDTPPDVASRSIRSALGLTYDLQSSWRDPYVALRAFRVLVEKIGVLVVQTRGIPVKEMRAFSIAEKPYPTIALNSKDGVRGKIFSLLHELTHIILNEGGICHWTDTRRLHADNRAIEMFCNQVAGSTLVPQDELLRHHIVLSHEDTPEWTDTELRKLERDFSASKEVILRRFLILGLTSEKFYRLKRAEFLEEYKRIAARDFAPPVSYEKRVVNSLGTGYVELVLDSYYENRISLSSVSDLLAVKIQYIPSIEQEVMGWSKVGSVAS